MGLRVLIWSLSTSRNDLLLSPTMDHKDHCFFRVGKKGCLYFLLMVPLTLVVPSIQIQGWVWGGVSRGGLPLLGGLC